jgi:drug/metabolite transporter (DMT)-like permease
LGVIFLGEELTWQLFIGAMLIVASVVVVNWRSKELTSGN